ncbi:MAG: GGDEF domain-containing protein [Bacillota bacterium]
MNYFYQIDLLVLCLAILTLVFINTGKNREHHQVTTKLFTGVTVANIIMVFLEIFSQLLEKNNNANSILAYNIISVLYFLVIPFATILIFYYLDFQIVQSSKIVLKRLVFFWILVLLNSIIVFTNSFHKLVFSIDSSGGFHRGVWEYFLWIISGIAIIILFSDVVMYSRKIDIRRRNLIILLCVPIVTGAILQMIFFGSTTLWAGMTFAILLINSSLQNTLVTTDYLTGVFNRRELDEYVNYALSKFDENAIARIFVDIDKFKSINDNYGHIEGDNAIRTIAVLINQNLRKGDFLSRYGGDEFVVIPKANDNEKLNRIIEGIRTTVDEYNLRSSKPYKLSLSMGFDIYYGKDKNEFFALLDKHMYDEKRRKHSR